MILFMLLLLNDPINQASNQAQKTFGETIKNRSAAEELAEEVKKFPLHFAARAGDTEALKQATDKELTRKDTQSRTPIMVAAEANHDSLLCLGERGLDLAVVSKHGETLLHFAARGGQTKNIEWLIGRGLEPDMAGPHNITPLTAAVLANQPEAVRSLMNLGADPAKSDLSGDSPVAYMKLLRNRKIYKMSLQMGWQGAPMHHAARTGDSGVILEGLAKGESVDLLNPEGESLLFAALSEGQLSVARILLHKKANPNLISKYGWSPLYLAAFKNGFDLVKLLLQAGADPNWLVPGGDSALGCALRMEHTEIVQLLLAGGANQLYGNPETQEIVTITPTTLSDLQETYRLAMTEKKFTPLATPFWLERTPKPVDSSQEMPVIKRAQIIASYDPYFWAKHKNQKASVAAIFGSDAMLVDIEICYSSQPWNIESAKDIIAALHQVRFEPQTRNGKPEDSEFSFSFENQIGSKEDRRKRMEIQRKALTGSP